MEFDLKPETLKWGIQITVDNSHKEKIKQNDLHSIIITGLLESIDADGFTVLRLGPSIIAFSSEGIPLDFIRSFITIKINELSIYDDGLEYQTLA